MDTPKDHPISIAVQHHNPEKKFKNILMKIQYAMPKYEYERCKNIDVYNRFRILTSPKDIIKIAKVAFETEWLIRETYFLVYLYEAYKCTKKIGEMLSNSSWMIADGIKSVLQLLMVYPAPDYGLFIKMVKGHRRLDLSEDNINSVYYVVDTYNLSDATIVEFICFCIEKKIRCDVVMELDSLWENERLNMIFLRKNFISAISVCFNNRKYTECLDPIFIQLCCYCSMPNKQLSEFVKKTKTDKILLQKNIRFRAKHILRYFDNSQKICKFVIPIFELMDIKMDGVGYTIYDAIKHIRTNQVLIVFLVNNLAALNNKAKHHDVFSNVDLLSRIFDYVDVTNYYRKLLKLKKK
jgi:hypothetical protein